MELVEWSDGWAEELKSKIRGRETWQRDAIQDRIRIYDISLSLHLSLLPADAK